MRDQQGFTDFASARGADLRRQAYLLTGSPERAVRLADKALADIGRRWDKIGGAAAAEEHARRVVATGAVRGRGVAPTVATTARGTAAPTDDTGEAVRRALAGLPPRRRAVLVLRYDEGLDDAAVGARLGVPPAAAAAEGEAGLTTLRSLLRRRGRPEDLLPAALAETPLPGPLTIGQPTHAAPPATADSAPALVSPRTVDSGPVPVSSEVTGSAGSRVAPKTVDSGPGAVGSGPGSSEVVGSAGSRVAPKTVDSGSGAAGSGPVSPAVTDSAGSRVAPGVAGSEPGSSEVVGSAGSPVGPGVVDSVGGPAAPAVVDSTAPPSAPTSADAATRPATVPPAGTSRPGTARPGTKDAGGRAGAAGRSAVGTPPAGEGSSPTGTRPAAGAGPADPAPAGDSAPAARRPVPVVAAEDVGGATAGDASVDANRAEAAAGGRSRRRWVVAAVVAVLVGVGAGVLVPALRNGSGAAGPVPASSGTGPALLPWPVRGPLAGDQDLLRSALRAWQDGVPDRQRPARSAALWAGDLDGVRTVLLQGTDASGQSWVAHVIGAGDTASLRSTEPLGRAVPLLALGTTAGAVRLLADPDAAPDSILAAVGGTFRPLAVARDSLSQGVTAPSAGLPVVLTDGGAVVGSGTVLPGRLSPVTGTVELTRSTLDLGPAQPPVQAWYDDGELVGRRLGGPVELVQVGPVRAASIRVNARPTRLEARAYEVVRGGTRYLATVVRAGGAPACTDTAPVGPADAVPAKPVALVARCIPPGAADGVLAAVGTRGIRSVLVTLAPATPAGPGRPGVPARPARAARTVAVTGTSGAGLVGLAPVATLPTAPLPAVARDGGYHQLARLTLPAYRGPRP